MRESRVSGKLSFKSYFSEPPVMAMHSNSTEKNERELRMVEELSAYPLLNDIPFVYLIPYETMLSDNEIRFFYLDYNWVCAFLDGMCSLGRSSDIDFTHDMQLIESIYTNAINGSGKVRTSLQGVTNTVTNSLGVDSVCTGFILRSQLVRGWRGLEFIAYEDANGEKELNALRIETLSEDVLFAMFHGIVARVDIGEPPEGLHYGLIPKGNNEFEIPIRSISDGKSIDKKTVSVSTRGKRVVDIEALASKIGEHLNEPITSAHMALELMRTAKRIEILAEDLL